MRPVASLRLRLLAGVLAAVAAVWVGVAIAAYRHARAELEAVFDAHLAQSASLLVAQITEDGGDEIELEHAPSLDRSARDVAFQVWSRGGKRLRVHSKAAPNVRLSRIERGFDDTTVDGVPWRVFSTPAAGRRLLVQVGERRDVRDAAGVRIALHLLLPLATGLPVLGIALAVAIGRGLRPLRTLADAVARREPEHLEPVAIEGAPAEVRPLVERLNALFARIGASLARERAFTADAAHELRTPLAAIRAQAQVAQGATSDPERRHALDQVIAGCDRAARLADQLLTLARLDAERPPRPAKPCDLAAVARAVVAEQAEAAHARGVALALAAGASGVAMRGDPTLLAVLVRNLVDNAVRYAGRGTVGVEVRGEPSGAVLRVTDDGPGIPASERGRVLDRFARGTGTDEPGSGLGLSIAARIAERHGATLALADGPGGRGLAAEVRFPA